MITLRLLLAEPLILLSLEILKEHNVAAWCTILTALLFPFVLLLVVVSMRVITGCCLGVVITGCCFGMCCCNVKTKHA